MTSFIWGSCLFFVLLYLALIFESSSLLLLCLVEAVLLMLAVCYLRKDIRQLKVWIEMPVSIAQRNREFHTKLTVAHVKRTGYRKVKVLVEYGNNMKKRPSKTFLTIASVPAGKSAYQFGLTIQAPGCYDFRLKKVRVYDMSGLFYAEKKLEGCASAMVMPKIREIPVSIGERVSLFFADADVYDELRPGYDPAETFGVREFRDGDKLPTVHWKLSAKTDELMVRERSLPKACPVVCFLNFNTKEEGAMLELVASLSFSMMDAGCPHFCVWKSMSDKDLIRTRVDDEESFYLFLTAFMQDRAPEEMQDIEDRYYEKYRGEHYLHEILLEDGKLYLDDARIEDTEHMELILN